MEDRRAGGIKGGMRREKHAKVDMMTGYILEECITMQSPLQLY
jgi:hypothetical protein